MDSAQSSWSVINDTDAKAAALRIRLHALNGREHKRQRSMLNKELYSLENDDMYVAAVREKTRKERAAREAAEAEQCVTVLNHEHEHSVTRPSNAHRRTTEERLHFRSLVANLFNEYAPSFEAELDELCYRTPSMIEGALLQAFASGTGAADHEGHIVFSSTLAVDLGCGTGLAALALHSRCHGRLIGCDLSRSMLAIAARKQRKDGCGSLYDDLAECDLISFLRSSVEPATADLIIAADVLVYMRELDDLFVAVEASLAPGGVFAFSTELARPGEVACPPEGPGWIERPSERLAHSEEYLRKLVNDNAGGNGRGSLQLLSLTDSTIRNDCRAPIWGQIAVVRKAAVQEDRTTSPSGSYCRGSRAFPLDSAGIATKLDS